VGDRIVVLGLGYVGLPLAVALARNFDFTGFDIDQDRVAGLQAGYDRTAVFSPESLAASTIKLTCDPEEGRAGDALVLGLTFKENVPVLRNSRSFDLVARLQELGHEVSVSEPIADSVEVSRDHGLSLIDAGDRRFDLVVGAVAHHGVPGDGVQAARGAPQSRRDPCGPEGNVADCRAGPGR
jgi:UDP-N-acetyl-D-mannosaminuronate dehydrogenase